MIESSYEVGLKIDEVDKDIRKAKDAKDVIMATHRDLARQILELRIKQNELGSPIDKAKCVIQGLEITKQQLVSRKFELIRQGL